LQQLKVKKFFSEAKKIGLIDEELTESFNQFLLLGDKGQSRYSLGGGLYKIRLALHEGQGKRGGGRSIFAFKNGSRFIWLHLFPKNEKDNITTTELNRLKVLAKILLGLPDTEISRLIKLGEILEVRNHDQDTRNN